MKKISLFERFDAQGFLKGKRLLYINGRFENSDKFIGCKVEVLIAEDMTDYDGEVGLNIYERLLVKVPDVIEDYLKQFKLNDEVYIENPVMKVWGRDQRRDSLSVTGIVKKTNK